MWFSVVCTLSDNDTSHHNGQNLLYIRSAAPRDHCDDAYSMSIRVQTTLNHIRFVKYRM